MKNALFALFVWSTVCAYVIETEGVCVYSRIYVDVINECKNASG